MNQILFLRLLHRLGRQRTLAKSGLLCCVRYFRTREVHLSSISSKDPPINYWKVDRLRRFTRFVGLGVVSAAIGFGIAVTPVFPTIDGLMNPPNDAETLRIYQPPDENTARIDGVIQSHPLVTDLRKRADFKESRPHLKIPADLRDHHFTGGLMSGPGKVTVPPLTFLESGGKSTVMIMHLGENMCGHPGIVHGGALATVLDEGLARCCFQALPNKIGMTANLNINYRAPLPGGTVVVLKARTTKVDGRKAWVEGRLESLPLDGEEPKLFVEASGLFIEPRQAKAMAQLSASAAG